MVRFELNGNPVEIDADPEMPLLWALRDTLGLTGSKYGCGIAQCGVCLVHVDGEPVPSCQTPLAAIEGTKVVTIEGVSGPVAEAVQAVWVERDVPQCGYCQSGQVMAAVALLTRTRTPSDADIDAAMGRLICRCATYQRIRAGIHEAARRLA